MECITETERKAEVDRGWLIFRWLVVLLVGVLLGWAALHMRRDPGLVWVMSSPGVLKYVDWFLAAWVGTILYLIMNVARYMIQDDPKFVRFTAWNIGTTLRGPFLAVVVLVLATNLDITLGSDADSAGLQVNIGALPALVLLCVAFLLGWFHRVALSQLGLFTQYFFPKAWALAESKFQVTPGTADVVPGGKLVFGTDPARPVVWTAALGSVGAEDGTYTAPKVTQAEFKEARGSLTDVVRAHLKSAPAISSFSEVRIVPFKMVVRAAADPGETIDLAVEPVVEVEWAVTDGTLKDSRLTLPPNETTVTVTAVSKKWGHTARAVVKVVR